MNIAPTETTSVSPSVMSALNSSRSGSFGATTSTLKGPRRMRSSEERTSTKRGTHSVGHLLYAHLVLLARDLKFPRGGWCHPQQRPKTSEHTQPEIVALTRDAAHLGPHGKGNHATKVMQDQHQLHLATHIDIVSVQTEWHTIQTRGAAAVLVGPVARRPRTPQRDCYKTIDSVHLVKISQVEFSTGHLSSGASGVHSTVAASRSCKVY